MNRLIVAHTPLGESLWAVNYDIVDNDYEGSAESMESSFRVDVEAIPADRPFRPPLTTPKPRTRGQLAKEAREEGLGGATISAVIIKSLGTAPHTGWAQRCHQ